MEDSCSAADRQAYQNSVSSLPRHDRERRAMMAAQEQTQMQNDLASVMRRKKELAGKLAPVPEFHREGHFNFMDLPAELRANIYELVLPRNLDISFRYLRLAKQPKWITLAKPKVTNGEEQEPFKIGYDPVAKRRQDGVLAHHFTYQKSETQILLVSKTVSNEAKAILYGSNTYNFSISGDSHFIQSLQSPLIFGPFGEDMEIRLPLLRNLRIIHLDVTIDENEHWAWKRHCSRLEYFVRVLKEHSEDENRKSLLEHFSVRMADTRFRHTLGRYRSIPPLMDVDKFMFGLEPLAQLRGIKSVKIEGVKEWYANCLELAIQGKGGDVLESDWPMLLVKKRTNGVTRQWKKVETSSRKWWQPRLNWKEFGERNGVELPEDVERYWMDTK